jgi:hypothetical protein
MNNNNNLVCAIYIFVKIKEPKIQLPGKIARPSELFLSVAILGG